MYRSQARQPLYKAKISKLIMMATVKHDMTFSNITIEFSSEVHDGKTEGKKV